MAIFCPYTYIPSRSVGDICKGKLIFDGFITHSPTISRLTQPTLAAKCNQILVNQNLCITPTTYKEFFILKVLFCIMHVPKNQSNFKQHSHAHSRTHN